MSADPQGRRGNARLLPEVNRAPHPEPAFQDHLRRDVRHLWQHGAIRQIRLGDKPDTRGIKAFVVYEDIYDAKNAVDHLSGFNVCGRYLIVLYYQATKMTKKIENDKKKKDIEDLKARFGVDDTPTMTPANAGSDLYEVRARSSFTADGRGARVNALVAVVINHLGWEQASQPRLTSPRRRAVSSERARSGACAGIRSRTRARTRARRCPCRHLTRRGSRRKRGESCSLRIRLAAREGESAPPATGTARGGQVRRTARSRTSA